MYLKIASMIETGHEFKGFSDPIAIFKTGKHVDSSGKKVEITESDLDEMISNFKADSIPYVIGHPEHDSPAFGWSDGLFKKNGVLFTKSTNVHSEFEQGVEDGAYRNRSVAINKNDDGKWYVRQIGWLGGAAPAVKGLAPLEFSENENDAIHTFALDENQSLIIARNSGWAVGAIGRLLRALKNMLIEDQGVEEADKRIPEYEIETISSAAEKLQELPLNRTGHMYSSPTLQNVGNDDNDLIDNHDETKENSMSNFTEQEVKQRETDAADAREKAVRKQIAHEASCRKFAEQLEADGKILPNQVESVCQFMQSLDTEVSLTFTEGEGDDAKQVEVNQFEQAQNLFNAMPETYKHLKDEQADDESDGEGESTSASFTAPAGMVADPDGVQLVAKANKLIAENPDMTFAEAVKAVS